MTTAPASTTCKRDVALAKCLGHDGGDGRDRATVVHQLAKHGAEQKPNGKNCARKRAAFSMKTLRPAREQGLPAKSGGNKSRGGSEQQERSNRGTQATPGLRARPECRGAPLSTLTASKTSMSALERWPRSSAWSFQEFAYCGKTAFVA